MGKRIEWKGGECPVSGNPLVRAYMRDNVHGVLPAKAWSWTHSGNSSDIIAYEVIEEAKDSVNHPEHYTSHKSGVECIQITEHMSFCLGNAVKYIWRADLKGNALEDLEKAKWYVEREIQRRAKGA